MIHVQLVEQFEAQALHLPSVTAAVLAETLARHSRVRRVLAQETLFILDSSSSVASFKLRKREDRIWRNGAKSVRRETQPCRGVAKRARRAHAS